jgi:hypothetical protein
MTDAVVVPFDKPRKRRFTKGTADKNTEFEMVSFRAPAHELRRASEIAESRIDPDLLTRSDILNDALHWWLQTFFEEHGEEIPKVKDRFLLDNIDRMEEARTKDLEQIRRMFEKAAREANRPLLGVIYFNIHRFITELETDPYASPVQKSEAEELAEKTRATIERIDNK